MSYVSQALDCFIAGQRRMKAAGLASWVAVMELFIAHLKVGQIFRLPPNGNVLPAIAGTGQLVTDSLRHFAVPIRLPFDECCIEFSATQENMTSGERWSKCIGIACDLNGVGAFQSMIKTSWLILGKEPPCSGIFVTSVYFSDELRAWVPNNYGMILHEDLMSSYFGLNDEAASRPDIAKNAENDLNIEIRSIAMMITALACSNVSIAKVSAPEMLNRKRIRTGKTAIRAHHVLVINSDKTETTSRENGFHASPRVHLRRGHIRRLETKNIWVNACVVGDKSRGIVTKDYKVLQR